ncbi:minor tail protein [Mycobacterium phage SWU2]|uniref:Minor tail protein n=1 Tax=Mycobacterium phage SWU2 TaxID=2077150 RepID=A0A2K9VI52_9CAUD|nr:minor tail protein [Mycobacterium phage SWU2]AUV61989.1 hypothetical protein JX_gp30 [Mycobacterium phage SWU2]
MMPSFIPTDWFGLFAYVIVALPAIIAAVAALRSHRTVQAQKHVAVETLNQVQNSHDTNLRDDIDQLSSAIREGFQEVRRDIGGLREEVRIERRERIEGDRLLRLIKGGEL